MAIVRKPRRQSRMDTGITLGPNYVYLKYKFVDFET